MAKGDPITSPWEWQALDGEGDIIHITIPFDDVTKVIVDGGVVHRDVGCRWSVIVWGVPSSPDAKRSPPVPEGDTPITAAQIQAFSGFTTIGDLLAVQVTAEAG